jgi:alkanesulfonate monooxygenase
MRIGFWPPVYGNWLLSDDPALIDASFDNSLACARAAEAAGFDTLLLAEHFINPLGAGLDQLDAWTAAAALAAATSRIEIIAAVKPGLRAPGVIAKMGAGIDRISGGRFAVNLVTAWWLPEYERLGAPVLAHAARYARSREFITIVKGLWTGDDFSFEGDHYSVRHAAIAPKPLARPHPPIYLGGESEAGKALAAEIADIFLFNGRPVAEAGAIIAEMDRRAAAAGRTLRHGMAAFVICRETEAAAQAELERLSALRRASVVGGDPDVAMHQAPPRPGPRVGINGGTDAGLVGTPDQIAARMAAFAAVGVETFLLQFHPTLTELERFGREVMPLIRGTFARALAEGR